MPTNTDHGHARRSGLVSWADSNSGAARLSYGLHHSHYITNKMRNLSSLLVWLPID